MPGEKSAVSAAYDTIAQVELVSLTVLVRHLAGCEVELGRARFWPGGRG
jgi:hypothetical protein